MTTLYREVTILDNGQIWRVKKSRQRICFPVSALLFLSVIIFIFACTAKAITLRAYNEQQERTKIVRIGENYSHSTHKTSVRYQRDAFKLLQIPLSEDLQRYTWQRCAESGIDYPLFIAQMGRESSYNPNAVSNSGDYGLMQINEFNLHYLSEQLETTENEIKFNPKVNIDAAILLWRNFIEDYPPTDNAGLLMRYNMGPKRASELSEQGIISSYASNILNDAELIRAQLHTYGDGGF